MTENRSSVVSEKSWDRRPHININVNDIEASVAFYSSLFGMEPTKRRAD